MAGQEVRHPGAGKDHSFATPLWVLCGCLCSGVGCGEDPLAVAQPKIEVSPETLDFGEGIVGRANHSSLEIRNRGAGPLNISSYSIEPSGAVFEAGEGPSGLGPGATGSLAVRFVPPAPRETHSATLRIHSNDPDRPELAIPLLGRGGVQELEIQPLDVDFGVVNEGFRAVRWIEIANVGKSRLVISRLVWTSTAVDMGLDPRTFVSASLEAGTATAVALVYSPTDLGGDQGSLAIFSDDEDEPEVTVTARGQANLAPVAVAFGCAPNLARVACAGAPDRGRAFHRGPRQRLALDGRESHDPEGGAISYRWWVDARPTGSNAAVFHSTEDRARGRSTGELEVDIAGTYQLRLEVTDERGLASFDRPESRVTIRPRDLEVSLVWDLETDVDLHVVAPGGTVGDYGSSAVGTSTGSDTCTFNRGPNWGDLGTVSDDPSLDIDDVTGRGPEIVSMDLPQDGGTYAAWVHYCDSHDVAIVANATLRVAVRGVTVAVIPASAGFSLAPGEAWRAAELTWHDNNGAPSLDVRDGSSTSPVMMPRLCRR